MLMRLQVTISKDMSIEEAIKGMATLAAKLELIVEATFNGVEIEMYPAGNMNGEIAAYHKNVGNKLTQQDTK